VPICQTTSYRFGDTGHSTDLFALAELGYIHTRVSNPMHDAFEQRIAAIEGGAAAVIDSTTQYIRCDGTTIGGVIIDGGNFPWRRMLNASRC
jgi:O-acetylhomoserine/O-acetylserine sulfhydrylase-like pyridoxal-dependent enzyme